MSRIYLKTDFREVYDKLSKLEHALEKKQEIMNEVGEFCRTEIRAIVDKNSRTGTLRDAIDYKLLDEDSFEVGLMHNLKNRDPEGNHRPTLIYGVVNEFGSHKMSSQSFMRTFWERKDEVQSMILEKIMSLIAEA